MRKQRTRICPECGITHYKEEVEIGEFTFWEFLTECPGCKSWIQECERCDKLASMHVALDGTTLVCLDCLSKEKGKEDG